jgi:hypothetical protein
MSTSRLARLPIRIGTLSVPAESLDHNFVIIGRTATGKSRILENAIAAVQRQNGKAVVYDITGTLRRRLGAPSDVAFNPGSDGGICWQIAAPGKEYVADIIAQNLYSKPVLISPLVAEQATREARSILRRAIAEGRTSNEDLANALTALGEESMVGKYLTVKSDLLCVSGSGAKFSLKEWLEDGQPGILWIGGGFSNGRGPLFSLFLDLLLCHRLTQVDPKETLHLFLDELPTIAPKVTLLLEALKLSEARLAIWMTLQNTESLEQIYGNSGTSHILNACRGVLAMNMDCPSAVCIHNLFGPEFGSLESLPMGQAVYRGIRRESVVETISF